MQLSLIDGSKVWFGSDSTSVPICSQWVQGWLDVDVGWWTSWSPAHGRVSNCAHYLLSRSTESGWVHWLPSISIKTIVFHLRNNNLTSFIVTNEPKETRLSRNKFSSDPTKGRFCRKQTFYDQYIAGTPFIRKSKISDLRTPLVCLHRLWAFEQYLLYAVSFWDISLVTALNTSQMTAPNIWTHCNITFYPTVIVT